MRKVLVVEENSGVGEMLEKLLVKLDLDPIVAPLSSSGVERTFLENRDNIVCVVSDGRINGDIDGEDVVKIIRRIDQDIPILAVTADGLIAVEMLRAGATSFLIKPFNIEEFLRVVKALVG